LGLKREYTKVASRELNFLSYRHRIYCFIIPEEQ
jgi:hypothetical protein